MSVGDPTSIKYHPGNCYIPFPSGLDYYFGPGRMTPGWFEPIRPGLIKPKERLRWYRGKWLESDLVDAIKQLR